MVHFPRNAFTDNESRLNMGTPALQQLTPEMIDGLVIQLRFAFEHAAGVPDFVRESGNQFVLDLDKWSETLKTQSA
jgi:hypothetical protein